MGSLGGVASRPLTLLLPDPPLCVGSFGDPRPWPIHSYVPYFHVIEINSDHHETLEGERSLCSDLPICPSALHMVHCYDRGDSIEGHGGRIHFVCHRRYVGQ